MSLKAKKKVPRFLLAFVLSFIILLGFAVVIIAQESNPSMTVQTNDAEWVVTKHAGEEAGLRFWAMNGKDKKTELGWIPKDNSCSGWADKFLYGQDGNFILDDQDKEIELKCESSKCDGFNCYYISLTTAQAVNIDEFVKLGNNSIITEYQNLSIINYHSNWFDVNISLLVNLSGNWSTSNDVWVRHDEEKEKFGAIVNITEDTYLKYMVSSDIELKHLRDWKYYLSKEQNSSCGIFKCNNEEMHLIDFSDICNERIGEGNINESNVNESDIVNEQPSLFNPSCSINQIDNYNLEIEFYGEYNATIGFIDVDPTVVVEDVSSYASTLSNITVENNFSHLSIGSIDFINDSNVKAYLPFDVNISSSTTYDYSSNDNDGTLINVTYNSTASVSSLLGGGYEFETDQASKSRIDLGSGVLTGASGATVAGWVKSNELEHPASRAWLDQTGGANNLLQMIHTTQERYNFRFYNFVQSTAVCQGVIVKDTAWHYVVGVYNGSRVLGYVDGVLYCTSAAVLTGNLPTPSSNLAISENGGGTANYWNGTIDDVLILDIYLNSSQIMELYLGDVSRLFPRGEQAFLEIDVSEVGFAIDTINVTIDYNEIYESSLNLSVDGVEYTHTNGFFSDMGVSNPENLTLDDFKIIFYGGTAPDSYITPNLINNITIDAWGPATIEQTNTTRNINEDLGLLPSPNRNIDIKRSVLQAIIDFIISIFRSTDQAPTYTFDVTYPNTCSDGNGCTGGGCSVCTYCSINFLFENYTLGCNGQNGTTPFFTATNNGTATIDLDAVFNSTPLTGINFTYGFTNSSSNASSITNYVDDFNIKKDLGVGQTVNIWMFGNRNLTIGESNHSLIFNLTSNIPCSSSSEFGDISLSKYWTCNPNVKSLTIDTMSESERNYFNTYYTEINSTGFITVNKPTALADLVVANCNITSDCWPIHLNTTESDRYVAAQMATRVWHDKQDTFNWKLESNYSLTELGTFFIRDDFIFVNYESDNEGNTFYISDYNPTETYNYSSFNGFNQTNKTATITKIIEDSRGGDLYDAGDSNPFTHGLSSDLHNYMNHHPYDLLANDSILAVSGKRLAPNGANSMSRIIMWLTRSQNIASYYTSTGYWYYPFPWNSSIGASYSKRSSLDISGDDSVLIYGDDIYTSTYLNVSSSKITMPYQYFTDNWNHSTTCGVINYSCSKAPTLYGQQCIDGSMDFDAYGPTTALAEANKWCVAGRYRKVEQQWATPSGSTITIGCDPTAYQWIVDGINYTDTVDYLNKSARVHTNSAWWSVANSSEIAEANTTISALC